MKTKGAVLWELGRDWEVVELDLDGPRDGEVLIRYVAAGFCHSDEHLRHGDIVPRFPIVGGHEGAGIIEEVGPGVTKVKPGDHVVCSFIPSCGHCRWCATGQQNLCDLGATILEGCMPDGSFRFHADGQDLGAMCMIGTFSQYATISEYSVREGGRRPAAGQGRAGRLRGPDRLGLGGLRGQGHPRRHGRDLRHRRDRHQRRPGCRPCRGGQHRRGGPAGQQAREGRAARRHPQRRLRRGGQGAGRRAHPRGRRRQGHRHRRHRQRAGRPGGGRRHPQGRPGGPRPGWPTRPSSPSSSPARS